MWIADAMFRRMGVLLLRLQSKLAFDDWGRYPAFSTTKGLGRIALLGSLLGSLWGIHIVLVILLWTGTLGGATERWQLCWQWCIYVVMMCTFHLAEFFTTAIYNPTVLTSDSYLINHSTRYTAAALLSWIEFWSRFWFLPQFNSVVMTRIGLFVVLAAQCVRSLAMSTCGESFNHLIQTSKKENHVLITHGIYAYFRHPSYVGFFYWSIGTQLILGNLVNTCLYAVATWMFFRRRIPYEEESLMHLFPEEYPAFVSRTWIGIPFIPTQIMHPQLNRSR